MNDDLRLARGFDPIAVRTPTGPMRADFPPGRGNSKDKGRKCGKGKGRGK